MDFIDLAAQQRRITDKLNANMARVLAHGQYINGPEVRELEQALAGYVGAKHAVGCASGTDALLMALMALGIGPGDAVFTTPFTFIATAEVISLLGATPVFVDIDPVTFNIDPEKLEKAIVGLREKPVRRAARASGPQPRRGGHSGGLPRPAHYRPPDRGRAGTPRKTLRPRAVIPVDLFGLPADYDAIGAVAARHGSYGHRGRRPVLRRRVQGRKACAFGHIACTSFFPAKPLGCYGDGGMCFTDDENIDEVLRSLRVHGQGSDKYDNVRIGINGRLDTLQAAILLAKFEHLPRGDRTPPGRSPPTTTNSSPVSSERRRFPKATRSAWAQYSILARDVAERALFMAKLKSAGIPTAIYYPKPLHLQTAFASLGYREGDFPVSEDCARRIFSLPMHPYLAAGDRRRIAEVLKGN